jgi:predicted Zn-dependent protease
LYSSPALPHAPGAPFVVAPMSDDATSVFDNGLPIGSTDWVHGGRLAGLVTPRALAGRSGLPPQMAPDNLALDGVGTGSVDDLIARTEDGLLVTCTWYNRMVDPQTHLITGLTRDGVYLVRSGEVVGRAGNYRFNESPVSLLARISDAAAAVPALGREVADYFPRTVMPALAVADFNFSSASDAV